MKEKNNNKFNLLSFLNIKHKKNNFFSLYNSSFLNKSNISSNMNKNNNLTINSSINHIVNNITINNNSIDSSYNNFYSKYKNSFSKRKDKNYMTFMDKMNTKNDISLKKSTILSRNIHNSFFNNFNHSILYSSSKNKKALKNRKKSNFKKKKLFLIHNNNIFNSNDSNNIISYNYNMTRENIKNPKDNSKCLEYKNSNLIKKTFSKKKSFNKKGNNNLNNKNNISKNNIKNKLNNKIFFDYILNKVYQKKKKNKNKNILINIKKDLKNRNRNYIRNNIKINNSINCKAPINKSVNNNINKQLNITSKNTKNSIYYSNNNLGRKDNNNKFLNENLKYLNISKGDDINKKNSILDNTISKLTSEDYNEGELELDDVQDIIVYYNLNKIGNKNYLFKQKDYNDFIEKRVCKYLNFFMK
jgi:hypothetical protein